MTAEFEDHALDEFEQIPWVRIYKDGSVSLLGEYGLHFRLTSKEAVNLRNCLCDRLEEIVPNLKYPGIDYLPLSDEEKEGLEEAIKDVERGNFITLEELNRKLEVQNLIESILKTTMGHITIDDFAALTKLLSLNDEDSKYFFKILDELHEDAKIAIDVSGNYVWIYNPELCKEILSHPELRIA